MIEGLSSFSSSIELSSSFTNSERQDSKGNLRVENKKDSEKDTDSTGLRLTPEQKQQVEELKKRDQEVRTHEQAHMAIGGALASPASFKTVSGPDNKQYATGGEVQIEISPVEGNPEQTIEKARKVRSAATAPANPSSQDMQVASQASQMEAQARAEKNKEQTGNIHGKEQNADTLKTSLNEKHSNISQKTTDHITNTAENVSVNRLIAGLAGQTSFSNLGSLSFNPNISKSYTPQNVADLYTNNSNIQKNSSSLSMIL